MSETRISHYRVAPDHPALQGHFPGHPLVPGVMLIEQAIREGRRWTGQRASQVIEAKFLAPLPPRHSAELRLSRHPRGLRFEFVDGQTLLARGLLGLGS